MRTDRSLKWSPRWYWLTYLPFACSTSSSQGGETTRGSKNDSQSMTLPRSPWLRLFPKSSGTCSLRSTTRVAIWNPRNSSNSLIVWANAFPKRLQLGGDRRTINWANLYAVKTISKGREGHRCFHQELDLEANWQMTCCCNDYFKDDNWPERIENL
jgi:hypothetical protein